MERITSAQPPPCMPKHPPLDIAEMQGMYMYKSRRGMKRVDESKETYKLPHRLIEKKRRDRINECIAQLKDLLPEHLKLTTLGHLEKAVVLELTLKHVKALSTVLEQQQQKIVSLQKDLQISDHGGEESSEEMFRSGFHLCAKEVLHYLAGQETSQDLTPSHVISHIQKVAAEVLHNQSGPNPDDSIPQASEKLKKPAGQPQRVSEVPAKNCVPVIQRTYPHGMGEQSGSDTDTDSGYGGERDKCDPKAQWSESHAKEGELKQLYGPLPQPAPVLSPLLPRPPYSCNRCSIPTNAGEMLVPRGHAGYVSRYEQLSREFADTSLISGEVPEGRVSRAPPEPHGLPLTSQSFKACLPVEPGTQRLNRYVSV
uniref:Basic helix-loop-helix family, member e40 n=1 Tax=Labrus bergylta TaxID=56723 RepID=A0A3Q3G211_9LABR